MLRSILSVVAGSATWGILWVLSNMALASAAPGAFREDGTTDRASLLLLILVVSVLLSMLAGFLTAKLAAQRRMSHVVVLAVLQLSIGIFVQSSVWNAVPLWYHLIFLALVVPCHLLGGKLATALGMEARSAAGARA